MVFVRNHFENFLYCTLRVFLFKAVILGPCRGVIFAFKTIHVATMDGEMRYSMATPAARSDFYIFFQKVMQK
jgi:hypothetical protein